MMKLKFALRTLFKSPFVTLVAIVSLALGIGANAAIFSLFNQMLLRSLPVQEPERLVNFRAAGPKPGSTSCNQAGTCEEVLSYPMFRDLQTDQSVFSGVAAHVLFGTNLAYKGQTASGSGVLVSGSYFPTLGVVPAIGRLLSPQDDRAVGASPVVVLSHRYWEQRFGASPAVLNDTLIVNGQSLTIVGVAPRHFEGTTLGERPQVYVPITLRGSMSPGWQGFADRRNYWAYAFARLKPGVTPEQATSAINAKYRAILNDVEAPLQKGMSAQTMTRFRARALEVLPGAQGQSSVPREARAPLTLLLGVTAFVLLIACANIANLLLARSAARAGEMAVRLSIGARRWQIMAQLLTESLVLATLGGIAGLGVAYATLRLIASLLPAEQTATLPMSLDGQALLFAGVITIGTGLLFGLFPALHSTRPDILSTLKGQSGQPSGARNAARFRTSLATVQIALSMTLLVAAGLFTKSLFNVSRVDVGLKVDNLVMFGISPSLSGYTPERSLALYERMERDLAAVPGVTSVTAATVPALGGSNWGTSVSVQGFKAGPDTDTHSNTNQIGPGYLRTMGTPLMAGREFTEADVADGAKVAIVNQTFAKKFGLGADAVGKRMAQDSGQSTNLDIEIVGLVQDAKYSEVKGETPPIFFRPYRQGERVGFLNFYVRTSLDANQLIATLPRAIAQIDPNLPVENLRTMETQVRDNVFLDRFTSVMSAAFAILATLLAGIGLYGVLAYTVSQRTREIGLRMALGAEPGRVRGMVLRQVGRMAIVGGVIGLAAAIWLGRMAESLLYELKGRDPAVLAGAVVALTLVALGAGFIPALRASRVDPMRALRYD